MYLICFLEYQGKNSRPFKSLCLSFIKAWQLINKQNNLFRGLFVLFLAKCKIVLLFSNYFRKIVIVSKKRVVFSTIYIFSVFYEVEDMKSNYSPADAFCLMTAVFNNLLHNIACKIVPTKFTDTTDFFMNTRGDVCKFDGTNGFVPE